jgi:hypothetical protein
MQKSDSTWGHARVWCGTKKEKKGVRREEMMIAQKKFDALCCALRSVSRVQSALCVLEWD